jgi:hypothetical protein
MLPYRPLKSDRLNDISPFISLRLLQFWNWLWASHSPEPLQRLTRDSVALRCPVYTVDPHILAIAQTSQT